MQQESDSAILPVPVRPPLDRGTAVPDPAPLPSIPDRTANSGLSWSDQVDAQGAILAASLIAKLEEVVRQAKLATTPDGPLVEDQNEPVAIPKPIAAAVPERKRVPLKGKFVFTPSKLKVEILLSSVAEYAIEMDVARAHLDTYTPTPYSLTSPRPLNVAQESPTPVPLPVGLNLDEEGPVCFYESSPSPITRGTAHALPPSEKDSHSTSPSAVTQGAFPEAKSPPSLPPTSPEILPTIDPSLDSEPSESPLMPPTPLLLPASDTDIAIPVTNRSPGSGKGSPVADAFACISPCILDASASFTVVSPTSPMSPASLAFLSLASLVSTGSLDGVAEYLSLCSPKTEMVNQNGTARSSAGNVGLGVFLPSPFATSSSTPKSMTSSTRAPLAINVHLSISASVGLSSMSKIPAHRRRLPFSSRMAGSSLTPSLAHSLTQCPATVPAPSRTLPTATVERAQAQGKFFVSGGHVAASNKQGNGSSLAALLDSMARLLLGSWFRSVPCPSSL
ncbi:hypothetical protein D9619_011126 [Psilocybe cf. subviscida]|uniref:Uncharacterized protein n=1 Tax=Psilocybe cf. subviscida TaxID=2480587 RepID=A0A8H5F5D6_9AGAR|nr:hypothetical protein D9619_011126 [Psilocybe cf. subviscida]